MAALLACLLGGCGDGETHKATPAMWVAKDVDTTIFLFGTMHALPRGSDWDDGPVGTAIAAADALVLELSPAEVAAAAPVMQELAPRSEPLAMSQRLSPALLTQYRKIEASFGFSELGGDRLDDWAVVLAIGTNVAAQAELSPAYGVETGLIERFRKSKKPISGLETAREQLLLFENLPAAAQRKMLISVIAKSDSAIAETQRLVAAWSSGDVSAMHALIAKDAANNPEIMQHIYTERNQRWAEWIEERMEKPGTVMVAVGAGHLAGPTAVPELLIAQGYKVERVQ